MLSTDQGLKEGEQTVRRPKRKEDQEAFEAEPTLLRTLISSEKRAPKETLSIEPLRPESAKIYAFLDIKQNEQVVQRIAITENTMVVGRADPHHGFRPDIDLTQCDPSSTVSRRHARIRLEKTHYYIEDLESRNKTRLGELKLPPRKPELLHDGDVVRFGAVQATFRLLGTSKLPISWSAS
jgi:pSer/pThr/pTyr-binding forkhead associated (FHA) protein